MPQKRVRVIERHNMKNRELVSELQKMVKELGGKALVRLNDGRGGGWFLGNVRRVGLAEAREFGLRAEPIAIALTVGDGEKDGLTLEKLLKKLAKHAEIADTYAEIGPAGKPLLPLIGVRAGTMGRVIIVAGVKSEPRKCDVVSHGER
jgi:hypothetical protein